MHERKEPVTIPMAREKATESPWVLVKGKNLLMVREVSFSLLLLALLEDQLSICISINENCCNLTFGGDYGYNAKKETIITVKVYGSTKYYVKVLNRKITIINDLRW